MRLTLRLIGIVLMCVIEAGTLSLVANARPPTPKQLTFEGPQPPFRARRRPTGSLKPTGMGLVDVTTWPQEPPSPVAPDVQRFARSLHHLCGWMPPSRPETYARWILESSRHFNVDPFLLAALIYDRSQCRPKHKASSGIGLAGISVPMHLNFIQKRAYTYWSLQKDGWVKRLLKLPKHLFYEVAMARAESNIYFAAALIRISQEQCPHNDGAFASLPHRHFISHVVWGDRVRGADPEDRILIARRRLIRHYSGTAPQALGQFHTVALISPLAGAPRKITSKMGDDRDGGTRRHRGIDFASPRGEWVRAVASGVVVLAGADVVGGGVENLGKGQALRWAKRRLGGAGLYITIRHNDGLRSLYMHLDDLHVVRGQEVKQGEIIGKVGRTGIKASQAHLHFELRHNGRHVDPLKFLGRLVISPMQTYRGLRLDYDQRRERRKRRRKR
jgi:murein DD-endopeptidase MepM/ murein hydrolase activator NlpD